MGHSLNRRFDDLPRKMLSASLPQGESAGKTFSDEDIARIFGADLGEAIKLSGLTPQAIAGLIGHANQSAISKLINDTKPTTMARMLAVDDVRDAWIEVLARRSKRFRVRTVIERSA